MPSRLIEVLSVKYEIDFDSEIKPHLPVQGYIIDYYIRAIFRKNEPTEEIKKFIIKNTMNIAPAYTDHIKSLLEVS